MYIALKACSFKGQKFKAGDTIPNGLVMPTAVRRLIKGEIIAEVGNAGPLLPASTSLEMVSVPIIAEEGTTYLDMKVDELLEAVHTIQKSEEEIIADIEKMTSEDVLIFIDIFKGDVESIREAANKRADELFGKNQPTADEFMAMKRAELVEIASSYGKTVTDKDTKQMLVDFIMEAQKQGSDE